MVAAGVTDDSAAVPLVPMTNPTATPRASPAAIIPIPLSEKPLAGAAPSCAIVLKSDIRLLLCVCLPVTFRRYGEGLSPSSGWTTHIPAKHHLDLATDPGHYLEPHWHHPERVRSQAGILTSWDKLLAPFEESTRYR